MTRGGAPRSAFAPDATPRRDRLSSISTLIPGQRHRRARSSRSLRPGVLYREAQPACPERRQVSRAMTHWTKVDERNIHALLPAGKARKRGDRTGAGVNEIRYMVKD